jgi:hypothetical protein
MTPSDFLTDIIRPGLANLQRLGGPRSIPAAERFLLAVAMQESALVHRYQVVRGGGKGPARGFWQFEEGGGVRGVLSHPASKTLAKALCKQQCAVSDPPWRSHVVWQKLETNDLLACGFARLLLWTDPHPIPTCEVGAWAAYAKRLWRPGKPHPDTWPRHWADAGRAVEAAP